LRGFFIGKIMARTRGRANPNTVNALLDAKLTEEGA
jgi:Asp-tRNA(Asn)/Glu-tRNA(Gln) amidotransferase B subunit